MQRPSIPLKTEAMKFAKLPSLFLACLIQLTPLAARLAQTSPALASSPLVIVLKWITMAAAVAGSYHTVSAGSAVLASAKTINGKVGTALTYKVVIDDGKVRTVGAWDLNGVQNGRTNGLPPGLTLSLTTGIISGTPTVAGTYAVPVKVWEHSNRSGATLSFTLTFIIAPNAVAPVINTPPSPQAANVGGSVTFSVAATGTGLTYQWFRDESPVSGGTGSSLTISPVTAADAGLYKVTVTSGSLSTTSTTARLTVRAETAIQAQPKGASVHPGESVTLSVLATGEGTLKYQWMRGNATLGNATGSSLTINPASANDAGDYTVVVTGDGGTKVSDVAKVTVVETPAARAVRGINTVSVVFSAIAGRNYSVEASDSITAPSWKSVGSVKANSSEANLVDTEPATQRFWRVRVDPAQ